MPSPIRRHHALAFAIALLPFAAAAQSPPYRYAPGPDLPGLGRHDPRIVADISVAPWNAIVRLQIAGLSTCTAVMVAPTIALTAAHCLFSSRLGHFVPASAIHILTGYNSGDYAAEAVAKSYQLSAGYDPRQPEATRGRDAARIMLAAPIVAETIPLPLAPAVADQHIILAGFNQDRAQRLQIDPDCQILSVGTELQRHNCTGTRGSSGGPLLARSASGWTIIGLQSGAYPRDAGGVAVLPSTLNALLTAP